MIQINELRIGNLIQEGKVEQIDNSLDEVYFSGDGCYLSAFCCNISPIPLSEEWLLKFGFQRFPWGLVKNELLFLDDLKCSYLILQIGNGFKTKVQYVHQLQNLYFCLTGAELTVA